MALEVYNTLTRQKEEFVPLNPPFVGIYVCGPTVYDHAHIGHAKGYVSFDVIVRYLRYLGYDVRYVQNITDVGHLTDNADEGEDKILVRAAQERVEPMELVETYMRSYFEDMDALNVVRPDISPRASGHIPEQIELVKTLLEKGFAYEVNGSVYFSVRSFPEYGKLSGRRVEELKEGTRVAVNPEKRDPIDFALWKRAEPGHILRWPSPWGWGYPGWHIECSTMAMKYLGETVDIRGGGLENIFPHNECEIAQSEAATGKQFAKYWLHWNMVTVDGVKMGKSLGNFTTIKQALQKHPPLAIRFFILSSHYRSPLDFSEEALTSAARGFERLHGTVRVVRAQRQTAPAGEADPAVEEMLSRYKADFLEAMDDDFNTPEAIGVLFDLNREVNALLNSQSRATEGTLSAVDALYCELGGQILGIIPERMEGLGGGLEEPLIELLIEVRQKLREAQQWELSDAIRSRLSKLGIALEDRPEGTTWRLTLSPQDEADQGR
ncbi:MAG: cysteine--tRNA ligase [Chloroflexota bacterium]|nr:cysteine--tRNA ligase [Chloroflexota bacterium]